MTTAKTTHIGNIEEVRAYLAKKGMSESEIAAALSASRGMADNCQEECEMCKPASGGTYDKGIRCRVVCMDEKGRRYEGPWGPCESIIAHK